MDPLRYTIAGLHKPDAYTPYAAGAKQYGLTGQHAPNIGPVRPEGMQGYRQRDMVAQARKQAALRRMQAAQAGAYMSPSYLRGQG